MKQQTWIPKDQLIVGQAYECMARNFTVGTWNGKEFDYMRYKFGSTFPDTELHWDDGPPYGTVKPLSAVPQFHVHGSHGELTVNAVTGDVIELRHREHKSYEYRDIVRFDVDEWRHKYPGEELEGMSMDILDIGFWCKDHEYVSPEEEWREDMRKTNEDERLDRAD